MLSDILFLWLVGFVFCVFFVFFVFFVVLVSVTKHSIHEPYSSSEDLSFLYRQGR